MLLVSLMRLGLIGSYAALLARPFLIDGNGDRIVTEDGNHIILG